MIFVYFACPTKQWPAPEVLLQPLETHCCYGRWWLTVPDPAPRLCKTLCFHRVLEVVGRGLRKRKEGDKRWWMSLEIGISGRFLTRRDEMYLIKLEKGSTVTKAGSHDI